MVGIASGIACFQSTIDRIVHSQILSGTFAEIYKITVVGIDKDDREKTDYLAEHSEAI